MITLFILPVLPVKPAIPIVMGANVGTTVTNTIVSLAQLTERNEFRRAFAGAVVHDIFNCLSVLVLLPLEVITGYLRRLTGLIIKDRHLSEGKKTNQKLLKVVTEPLTKLIIQIDKKVITKIALDKTDGKDKSLIKNCKTEEISVSRVGEETNQTRNVTIITEKDTCSFLFEGTKMSDTAVGVILLVVTLAILMPLCCLKFIVKILHSMLRSRLAKIVKKTINADFPVPFKYLTGYLANLVGAGMTILLQSSAIFASAITPLIGVGIMTLERAFSLTLGANIGTTATGIIAALASSSNLDKALQIAFCHLFFNISFIILWYPIPHLRRVPIRFAKSMGNKSAEYRWFAVSYLILLFFIFPATVFGLSLAGWQVLLGVCLPFVLFLLFVIVVNILQRKAPHILPERLQDWEWLPEWLRSLEPFDCFLIKTKTKIKNCWEAVVLYFHR
mgnify:CR=1 FL=1